MCVCVCDVCGVCVCVVVVVGASLTHPTQRRCRHSCLANAERMVTIKLNVFNLALGNVGAGTNNDIWW